MTQLRTINTNLSFRAKSHWERLRATGSDRGRPRWRPLEVLISDNESERLISYINIVNTSYVVTTLEIFYQSSCSYEQKLQSLANMASRRRPSVRRWTRVWSIASLVRRDYGPESGPSHRQFAALVDYNNARQPHYHLPLLDNNNARQQHNHFLCGTVLQHVHVLLRTQSTTTLI
eukprot:6025127-Pleurochrysis_carterae.AAC.1